MAGGKYLQQKPPRGGRSSGGNSGRNFDNFDDQRNSGKKSGGKKTVLIILIVVLVLIIALAVACIIYYNSVLNMMSRPDDVTVPTLSEEELAELRGTVPVEMPTAPTETTSPEETWPEVVSDQNITNIMLIGQAAREGEDYRLSDSNIIVSINRETKTVTLSSILRDLRVNIPAYDGHQAGFNRINVVYHLGSYYTGEKIDSIKMMEQCIENNFGVKIDHIIEIDFTIFEQVVNLLGGVEVELSEEEMRFMKINYYYHEPVLSLETGLNNLDGFTALCYARLRKVGNGDWDRTARQRLIISKLFEKLQDMNIMDVHNIFKQVLPNIFTDMTNEEITNYAFEFIPMLAGLNIQSHTIPAEGTWWGTDLDPDGVHNYVIDCNLQKNGQILRDLIGYDQEEN